MNTFARAHRILTKLGGYQKAECSDELYDAYNTQLGEYIGIYKNHPSAHDAIFIFENGLRWRADASDLCVMFVDIAGATLPGGKESSSLLLKLKGGQQLQLPVSGQKGQFFDSLEMLRFIDRVTKDFQESAHKNI